MDSFVRCTSILHQRFSHTSSPQEWIGPVILGLSTHFYTMICYQGSLVFAAIDSCQASAYKVQSASYHYRSWSAVIVRTPIRVDHFSSCWPCLLQQCSSRSACRGWSSIFLYDRHGWPCFIIKKEAGQTQDVGSVDRRFVEVWVQFWSKLVAITLSVPLSSVEVLKIGRALLLANFAARTLLRQTKAVIMNRRHPTGLMKPTWWRRIVVWMNLPYPLYNKWHTMSHHKTLHRTWRSSRQNW